MCGGVGVAVRGTLTTRHLGCVCVLVVVMQGNRISDVAGRGVQAALEASSALTNLDLSFNNLVRVGCCLCCDDVGVGGCLRGRYRRAYSATGWCCCGCVLLFCRPMLRSLTMALTLVFFLVPSCATFLSLFPWRARMLRCAQGDETAKAIASSISVHNRLHTLNLKWNGVGHAGATALAYTLRRNTCLLLLDLSWNSVGDRGGFAFAEALAFNQALRVLDLSQVCVVGCRVCGCHLPLLRRGVVLPFLRRL